MLPVRSRHGLRHASATERFPRVLALVAATHVIGLWWSPPRADAFDLGVRVDFAAGTSPRSVAIGDVNGEGRPHLAVANYGSSTVSVLLGDEAAAGNS